MTLQFDEVSHGDQRVGHYTLAMEASHLNTSKGCFGYKATNADISTDCNTETVSVTATVTMDDGQTKTYKWTKDHGGRIADCKHKVLDRKILVTLTKSKKDEHWSDDFIKNLATL